MLNVLTQLENWASSFLTLLCTAFVCVCVPGQAAGNRKREAWKIAPMLWRPELFWSKRFPSFRVRCLSGRCSYGCAALPILPRDSDSREGERKWDKNRGFSPLTLKGSLSHSSKQKDFCWGSPSAPSTYIWVLACLQVQCWIEVESTQPFLASDLKGKILVLYY